MTADSLPDCLSADPAIAIGVIVRMAAAVAAGGLPVFPRLEVRLQAVAVVAFSAVALPAAVPAAPRPPLVPLLVGEAIVGLGLGLVAAVIFAAASWAGRILGTISGLSWADDFTPDAPAGDGAAARLAGWLAVAGFLAAGGHLAIVAGLFDSVTRLPVGCLAATGEAGDLADLVATAPSLALGLAISLAAPAVAAVLSFHAAAAICLRTVRFAAGAGLLQAVASLVVLGAVWVGAGLWTEGFAAAAAPLLERCLRGGP
jgi:flagellar biosynthesis protein FliR